MRYLKPFSLPLGLLAAVLVLQLHVKLIRSEEKIGSYEVPSYEQFQEALNLQNQDTAEELPADGRIISDKELLVQLTPLLASRSVEHVAGFLKNDAVTLSQRLVLLDTIVADMAYGFSHDDAIQLVLDIANTYAPNSSEQEQIFGVLLKYADLLKKSSPLFIAIANDYTRTYLPLLAWSIKNAANNPAVEKDLSELKMRALVRAVDLGKEDVLDKVNKFTIKGITPEEATDLVWHIATTGNHPELLAKLKEFGADMNQGRGKATPLIEAVEKDHKEVVQQLIALKVDLDKIADAEYGTALQRALAQRNTGVEEMLRQAGARE